LTLADDVLDQVDEHVVEEGMQKDKPLIVTDPDGVRPVLATAQDVGFDHLSFVTAVDWPRDELEDNADWLGFEEEREVEDPEEGDGDDEDEGPTTEMVPVEANGWHLDDVDDGLMEVVYNLYSYDHGEHLAVQVWVPREPEDCTVPTISDLWAGANWHEREVYDLYGVTFEGHPNLKRMFMPEDWEGHPHRKDYDLAEQQYIYREDGIDKVTKDPGEGW
jgi:NADH:ubiquinone oxidoreductase subunit C